MTMDLDLYCSSLSKAKVRRYLFALLLWGLAVYFFLPRFAAMKHALLVISNLRIPFVALSVGAQLLSYLGSGYLLRTVVGLAAKPISVIDGALITAGANSVGTLWEAAVLFVSYSFFRTKSCRPIRAYASFFQHSQPSEADAWSDKSGRPRNASTMRITMTI